MRICAGRSTEHTGVIQYKKPGKNLKEKYSNKYKTFSQLLLRLCYFIIVYER